MDKLKKRLIKTVAGFTIFGGVALVLAPFGVSVLGWTKDLALLAQVVTGALSVVGGLTLWLKK